MHVPIGLKVDSRLVYGNQRRNGVSPGPVFLRVLRWLRFAVSMSWRRTTANGSMRQEEVRTLFAARLGMNKKPDPYRDVFLRVLREMTLEQRLLQALEMGDMTRRMFMDGLRRTFPEKTEDEIHQIYLERLAKCHNQDYWKKAGSTLEELGIPYMLTGSLASSAPIVKYRFPYVEKWAEAFDLREEWNRLQSEASPLL
ncbi:MAG: hypothetical protein U1D30_00995 [Planctomycetota bacterium]